MANNSSSWNQIFQLLLLLPLGGIQPVFQDKLKPDFLFLAMCWRSFHCGLDSCLWQFVQNKCRRKTFVHFLCYRDSCCGSQSGTLPARLYFIHAAGNAAWMLEMLENMTDLRKSLVLHTAEVDRNQSPKLNQRILDRKLVFAPMSSLWLIFFLIADFLVLCYFNSTTNVLLIFSFLFTLLTWLQFLSPPVCQAWLQ